MSTVDYGKITRLEHGEMQAQYKHGTDADKFFKGSRISHKTDMKKLILAKGKRNVRKFEKSQSDFKNRATYKASRSQTI